MLSPKIPKITQLFIFFVITQILLFLIGWITIFVIDNYQIGETPYFEFSTDTELIIIALIIAPFFETLVFNLILNELFFLLMKKILLIIFITSLLFSLTHIYNWVYLCGAFLAGISFNFYYFQVRQNFNYKLAGFLVWGLHFNHNGIGLLLDK